MMSYNDLMVNYVGWVILWGLTTSVLIWVFMIALKQQRVLDRYRLKYSFDRELEFKETEESKSSEERNNRLDRRYKAFLRRTYKD